MSTSRFEATIATNVLCVRRERDTSQFYMEQIEGEGVGAPHRIPLDKNEVVIGRTEDSDICVPSRKTSRHHAYLIKKGTDYIIRDNDSHNGVFLNGVKINSAILRDGDFIQIADSAFIFRES